MFTPRTVTISEVGLQVRRLGITAGQAPEAFRMEKHCVHVSKATGGHGKPSDILCTCMGNRFSVARVCRLASFEIRSQVIGCDQRGRCGTEDEGSARCP